MKYMIRCMSVSLTMLLFSQCDPLGTDQAITNADMYFSLAKGNKWTYQVTRRNNGYGSLNQDYIQTMEITEEAEGIFTLISNSEGNDDFSKVFKLKKGPDGVYTTDGQLVVPAANKTFNIQNLTLLFQAHFNPASYDMEASFKATDQTLKCSFTKGLGTIFSQTFIQGVGLASWTNQKNTNGYYGFVSDTYRGTLKSATINGVTTHY